MLPFVNPGMRSPTTFAQSRGCRGKQIYNYPMFEVNRDMIQVHNMQLNHYFLKSHKWTCIRYNRSFYFQNERASHRIHLRNESILNTDQFHFQVNYLDALNLQ